jgi:rare lipoprotein A
MARLGLPCLTLLAAPLLFVCGCASAPSGSSSDGPLPEPPVGLAQTPDALPKIEPIRQGGPNRPYTIDGRSYMPQSGDVPMHEKGIASWYGRKFHGKATAIGEPYDMHAMTAAHPTMPLPSYARVRNPANGREVIVRVNDRGPFVGGRIIDLSYAAALRLGLLNGIGMVEVERLTHEVIRTGAWRREGPATAQAPVVVPSGVVPVAATGGESAATTSPVGATPAQATPTAPPAPEPAPPSSTNVAPASNASGTPTPPASATPTATVRPIASAARGYWVQLGAFRQREGAETLHRQVAGELAWIAPLLVLFQDSVMHRVQAGPYASRDEANAVTERLRETLKLVPLIVERR